jgi:hypothetical protein
MKSRKLLDKLVDKPPNKEKPLYEKMHDLRLEMYKKNSDKYDLILEFINLISPKKYKMLTEVKNVDTTKWNDDKIHETLEINNYRFRLNAELGIDIEKYYDSSMSSINNILSQCVDSIGYSLSKRRVTIEKRVTDSDDPDEKIISKKWLITIECKNS